MNHDYSEAIGSLRNEIDKYDAKLIELFEKRMSVCAEIARLKQEYGADVLDSTREKAKHDAVEALASDGMVKYDSELIETVMRLSRSYQNTLIPTRSVKRLLVINGPNLNMLGIREPEIYGESSYASLVGYIKAVFAMYNVGGEIYQSNHEGCIVDKIQSAYECFDGIVINPAAYTHTSIAIHDAIKAVKLPAVEVHLSDIQKRENFRHNSFVSAACIATFAGMGFESYKEAISLLCDKLQK